MRFTLYFFVFLAITTVFISPQISFSDDINNEVYLLPKDNKLLAFSGLQNKWSEKDLRTGETVIKSEYDGNVAVAYTQERALAFSGITGRWSEERFRIHETVESIKAQGNVGTIITNIRALAYSAKKGIWVESVFDIHD